MVVLRGGLTKDFDRYPLLRQKVLIVARKQNLPPAIQAALKVPGMSPEIAALAADPVLLRQHYLETAQVSQMDSDATARLKRERERAEKDAAEAGEMLAPIPEFPALNPLDRLFVDILLSDPVRHVGNAARRTWAGLSARTAETHGQRRLASPEVQEYLGWRLELLRRTTFNTAEDLARISRLHVDQCLGLAKVNKTLAKLVRSEDGGDYWVTEDTKAFLPNLGAASRAIATLAALLGIQLSLSGGRASQTPPGAPPQDEAYRRALAEAEKIAPDAIPMRLRAIQGGRSE